MEFKTAELADKDVYKLLTGCVVPRPIAWISTVDAHGSPNLAPFSFFNAVCSNPPTVLFCPGIRAGDKANKDTLHNIRATGVFIINFVTEALAEAMNLTSVEAPPEVNEFERAGLATLPGVAVNVPRVADSPVHFECELNQIVTISEETGGGHIVIGTVKHIHIADEIFQAGFYIDTAAYAPVGRLAGPWYSFTREFFSMTRPPSEVGKSSSGGD